LCLSRFLVEGRRRTTLIIIGQNFTVETDCDPNFGMMAPFVGGYEITTSQKVDMLAKLDFLKDEKSVIFKIWLDRYQLAPPKCRGEHATFSQLFMSTH
jgi:hypothetical protein